MAASGIVIVMSLCIVGPFGPAQLACLRSWRAHGWKTVFIHLTEVSSRWPVASGLVDHYLALPRGDFDSPQSRARMLNLLVDAKVCGITALSYELIGRLHLLADTPDWPRSVRVCATPLATLPFLDDKLAQLKLAGQCRLGVEKVWALDPGNLDQIPASAYPIVVRPNRSGSVEPEFKVKFIPSQELLAEFVASCREIKEPLVVQSYLNGTNVIVHGVRSAINGEVVQAAFEVRAMLDGVSLCVSTLTVPDDVVAGCKVFVEKAGVEGVYHFEFRRMGEDGRYVILEINGRLGGTTGKVLRLGYDEPALLAQAFLSDKFDAPDCVPMQVAANRQAILKAATKALGGRLTIFDYPAERLPRRLLRLALGTISWRDEILHYGQLRSALAFVTHQLTRGD